MNTANYTNQIQHQPTLQGSDTPAVPTFHLDTLRQLGFTDRGSTWSNTNEQYHSLETQLGTLCVVGFAKVFLLHGNKEDYLDRINSVRMLTLFIEMLS